MKKGILTGLAVVLVLTGCASTGKNKEMSAKDEARYVAAIEKAEAEHPSKIHEGDEYIVSVGEVAAADAATVSSSQLPTIDRSFSVSRNDYDEFFSKSPAVVLGRMKLDPITDGGTLLGYRIKELKSFQGVDLADEDIIIGIDGKLPKNPDEYFNSWEKAKAANSCKVNIQRGTDRFDLVWTVKE
ncbi:MAG: hypothetical protein IJU23_00920 [Proteobacteria bacterium]|nr:hypothetical protein [Pseudomonadota bacterium]